MYFVVPHEAFTKLSNSLTERDKRSILLKTCNFSSILYNETQQIFQNYTHEYFNFPDLDQIIESIKSTHPDIINTVDNPYITILKKDDVITDSIVSDHTSILLNGQVVNSYNGDILLDITKPVVVSDSMKDFIISSDISVIYRVFIQR